MERPVGLYSWECRDGEIASEAVGVLVFSSISLLASSKMALACNMPTNLLIHCHLARFMVSTQSETSQMICSQKFQNQQLICVMKLANNKGFGILNTSGGPAWVGCKHIHGTCKILVFAEIDCILTAFIQKVQQTPKEDLIYRKTGWGGDCHFTHFTHINRPMRESTFQVIISLKGGKKKDQAETHIPEAL